MNGDILVTRADAPELWSIDSKSHTAEKVLTITTPDANGLQGLAQIRDDVFVFVSVVHNITSVTETPSGAVVWKLDMKKKGGDHGYGKVEPEMLAKITRPAWINKLAPIDDDTILITDSYVGLIYRLSISTGVYSVAFDDRMKYPPGAPQQLGVNGIALYHGYLYYDNAMAGTLNRMRINQNLKAIKPFETIATSLTPDGFDIDDQGNVIIATIISNSVVKVSPEGTVTTIVGDIGSLGVARATDVRVVQGGEYGERGKTKLFICTSGAQFAPVNGTLSDPGKAMVVELE